MRTTHWHVWPCINEVRPDNRQLSFAQWIHEFCKLTNITLTKPIKPPLELGGLGVQTELFSDE